MREITGTIDFPEDAPESSAARVTIQVLDISMADAPAIPVAEQQLDEVDINPGGQLAFEIQVEDVEPNRTLSLRVHVSLDGSGDVKSGDLLTTAHYPVPARGTPPPLQISTRVI